MFEKKTPHMSRGHWWIYDAIFLRVAVPGKLQYSNLVNSTNLTKCHTPVLCAWVRGLWAKARLFPSMLFPKEAEYYEGCKRLLRLFYKWRLSPFRSPSLFRCVANNCLFLSCFLNFSDIILSQLPCLFLYPLHFKSFLFFCCLFLLSRYVLWNVSLGSYIRHSFVAASCPSSFRAYGKAFNRLY